MTLLKKLASCVFAAVLGASLMGVPAMAFADENAPATKGITDQFSSFSDEEGEQAAAPERETAEDAADEANGTDAESAESTESGEGVTEGEAEDGGYEGVVAGQNATGEWQQEAAPSTYVFDEYGLFTNSEYKNLELQAEVLASQYKMGVYLLVVDTMDGNMNPSSDERTRFATKYYMDHSLGLGSGKDGIMLVIAVKSRDYVTIAYGQGSYSFSNEGISSMEEHVKDYLGDNDWAGGAQAYYDDIGGQLDYYAQHGKPGKPLTLFDLIVRIAAIILIPFIIASMVVGGWKRAMKTAGEKSEAFDYLDQSSLVLTASDDMFINSSVIATPRADDSKSGGGGGGWGGGGGGGFSSSGGGKF